MASFNINSLREAIQKNQRNAIIGAVVGLVVIAGLLFHFMAGGGDDSADQANAGGGFSPNGGPNAAPFGAPGTPPGTPGSPPGAPTSPAGPGGPGAPPPGAPTAAIASNPAVPDQGAAGGQGTAPVAGARPGAKGKGKNGKTLVADVKPLYAPRQDPFVPIGVSGPDAARVRAALLRLAAQQKEAADQAQLSQLPGITIYRPHVEQPKTDNPANVTQPETPITRRTAGLLYGDRVLAVLESNGASSVVKPGDVLESGGQRVRVTRIDRDGIVLRRLDGNRQTVRVPLSTSAEGASATPTPPVYPGGPSGFPGRGPGGPPRPGGAPPFPQG